MVRGDRSRLLARGARETRGVMDPNLLPFLGNVALSKLGAADIDRFYRRLRELARDRPRRRRAGGEGQDPRRLLGRIFDDALLEVTEVPPAGEETG
jgi:hypothetical protein